MVVISKSWKELHGLRETRSWSLLGDASRRNTN
jgi:hypothetical protein